MAASAEERLARLETRQEHLATKEDIANLRADMAPTLTQGWSAGWWA